MDSIPFDFEFTNSDPPFTVKALQALEWVAQQDRYTSVRVMHWRDKADVGWIIAQVYPPARGNFYGRRVYHMFRVSPLGHVYNQGGDLVRDGGTP